MLVARAAPETSICRAKINTGSSTTFSTAPDTSPIMEKKALPWKRSWLLSTQDMHIKGAPQRIKTR